MNPWFAVMLLAMSAGAASTVQSQDPGAGSANDAKSTGSNAASAPTTGSASGKADTQNATSEKKKPKKVWTNDEIGSVKGGVSVVGDGKAGSAAGSTKQTGDSSGAHAEMVRNYRDQIQKLRDQIAAADSRIEQLKSFKGQNTSPSGGININQGYNMVPVEEQVKQLEEKKKKLEAKIEDVEVEATKNGVDPGELR